MQKKNFLNSLIAAMLLLSATSIMVSCDDVVDNPSSSSSAASAPISITNDGARLIINSSSDVSSALDQLKSDIASKGSAEYEVTINNRAVDKDGSDFTVTVPKVEGSNINLNFERRIEAQTTLVVKASESTSKESSTAVNSLTITMPQIISTDAINLDLNMPETTVTLETSGSKTVYDEVEALTAKNTLIIKANIIIKKLHVKGGTVVIEDGGTVETIVVEGEVDLGENGVALLDAQGKPIVSFGGQPYYFKSIKAADGGELIINYDANSGELNQLLIGEGATVSTYIEDTDANKNIDIQIKKVVGEGDGSGKFFTPTVHAKYNAWAGWDDVNNEPIYAEIEEDQFRIIKIRKISNIELTVEKNGISIENTILEDVTTSNMGGISLNYQNMEATSSSLKIKGCKFITNNIYLMAPNTTESVPSFNLIFEDCEFKFFKKDADAPEDAPDYYTMQTWGWVDDSVTEGDQEHIFTFKNCKTDGQSMNEMNLEALKKVFTEGGSTPEMHESTDPGQAGVTHTVLVDIEGKQYTYAGNWGSFEFNEYEAE